VDEEGTILEVSLGDGRTIQAVAIEYGAVLYG
jgi:hypothetical protein